MEAALARHKAVDPAYLRRLKVKVQAGYIANEGRETLAQSTIEKHEGPCEAVTR